MAPKPWPFNEKCACNATCQCIWQYCQKMKEQQNAEKMQDLSIWAECLFCCQFFQCYHQQHASSPSEFERCHITRDDDAVANRSTTPFHQAPTAADDCNCIMQGSWLQWLTQFISTDTLCWSHRDNSLPAITHQEVLHNVMLPPFNPVLTPLRSALHDVLVSNHMISTPFFQNCYIEIFCIPNFFLWFMCFIAISTSVSFILSDSQHCHTPHLIMGWLKVSDEQKKEAHQEVSQIYQIQQKEQAAAAKINFCASSPTSISMQDPMEPLSPCFSQAPPAGKWLLSNSVTHITPADCFCRNQWFNHNREVYPHIYHPCFTHDSGFLQHPPHVTTAWQTPLLSPHHQ